MQTDPVKKQSMPQPNKKSSGSPPSGTTQTLKSSASGGFPANRTCGGPLPSSSPQTPRSSNSRG